MLFLVEGRVTCQFMSLHHTRKGHLSVHITAPQKGELPVSAYHYPQDGESPLSEYYFLAEGRVTFRYRPFPRRRGRHLSLYITSLQKEELFPSIRLLYSHIFAEKGR